jgi:UDP-2,3-diacylglucosamine pyrophosphatase LpxH
MGGRTKRIFISDIHMGDDRSMSGDHPYCWFMKNVDTLAGFLEEQRKAPDVKEVVILGDLFDDWVIPTDIKPLTSFNNICSNKNNEKIIASMRALAADPDVKLAYVPGNHDMCMHNADMAQTRWFVETVFPGIRYICDSQGPVGTYNLGTIAAEHGHKYALFNAPWKNPDFDCFLPLGYFISRLVAYKVSKEGTEEDPRKILINFLKNVFSDRAGIIEDMLAAIAEDANLAPDGDINLNGITGYPASKKIKQIGKDYRNLIQSWKKSPEKVNIMTAIAGDAEDLSLAASDVYFNHLSNNTNIVIFGHTHVPTMVPHGIDPSENFSNHDGETPWLNIYANCGTWVDKSESGCTYVETEEVPGKMRHYVRVMKYPEKTKLYEGFVQM